MSINTDWCLWQGKIISLEVNQTLSFYHMLPQNIKLEPLFIKGNKKKFFNLMPYSQIFFLLFRIYQICVELQFNYPTYLETKTSLMVHYIIKGP